MKRNNFNNSQDLPINHQGLAVKVTVVQQLNQGARTNVLYIVRS